MSVQGHTRAISDADWSYANPFLMTTCSLDGDICLWDIRETKKPKSIMPNVTGASQVSRGFLFLNLEIDNFIEFVIIIIIIGVFVSRYSSRKPKEPFLY